ncbi:hypothetical protein DAEQUDRAFT_765741 [Daedalea quercina L-15889]|uniref:Integral membrane protein n=1 Tax=Daedalea quercina L-15889 TaxID=1314783 RepID=A0A165QA82_9APHY|nr:hypothetical protein DAEQUDRAFT_765741 [Daedalea quercina L-15889]
MLTYALSRFSASRSNVHSILVLALVLSLVVVCPAGAAPVTLEGAISITSGACYADVLIIYNLVSYLISNYVTHASAIPVGADIGRYAQRVTRQDGWLWNLWLSIIALFLPFFALARTTILIAQQIRCKGDGVLAALQHGALLVVVRTKEWEPSEKDEIVYTRLPEGFDSYPDSVQADKDALPLATIVLDAEGEENAYHEADQRHHMLHGIAHPPKGYALAIPMRKGHTECLIRDHLKDTRRLKVHYRPGVMGIVLSVVQIGIGSYNLYTSRSNEIPRWGYAAYSLSVIPYVIMSVMNLLCAAIVDSYACAQLLRTPILEESLRREADEYGEPEYDGTIGTVKHASMPNSSDIGDRGRAGYVAVRMCTGTRSMNGFPQKYLVVDGGQWSRTYQLVSDGDKTAGATGETFVVTADVRAEISLRASRYPSSCHEESKTENIARFTVSALSHNGPPPKVKVQELDAITDLEVTTIACLFLVAMILPHAMIYALTRYHANQSTVAQRAWMMAWLMADQFSACSTLACWVLWKKRQNVIPDWLQKSFYAVLMVAGAGGFVTVVEMYLQDHDYGFQTCSL